MEENSTPWWAKTNSTPANAPDKKLKKHRPFAAVLTFAAILGGMVGAVALSPDLNAPQKSAFNSMEHPANALATVGQCGGIFDFDVPYQYSGQLPPDFFQNPNGEGTVKRQVPSDPMTVPAFGYFYTMRDEPVKTFWELDEEKNLPQEFEYLGYMWSGWTVIWYSPDSGPDAIASVKDYVAANDKVMAMPWVDSERTLPMGRSFAFGAWGATRSCGLWDARLADEFIAFATESNKGRDIENPHDAVLDMNGELYRIDIRG